MFLIIHINGKVFGYLGKFTYLSSILFFFMISKTQYSQDFKEKDGGKTKKNSCYKNSNIFSKNYAEQ